MYQASDNMIFFDQASDNMGPRKHNVSLWEKACQAFKGNTDADADTVLPMSCHYHYLIHHL